MLIATRASALSSSVLELLHDGVFDMPRNRPLPKVSVGWLKQIAFNMIRDWRRRNLRVTYVEELVAASRPEISPDDVDEYEEILKFFQWLTDDERDMLEMVLVESKGILEAGETLNLEKWAAYKTYERALEHLRDLVSHHGKFSPSKTH